MKKRKIYAYTLVMIMGLNVMPYQAFALTGGPSQPEVESFKPIEVTDMVNHATGDFSYNIPLMEVGGYPINLIYDAGITMDQEASIVGLGWNINPGVITRSVRGIPDDFNGDEITKEMDMKENWTWGGSIGAKFELFGVNTKILGGSKAKLKAKFGVNYNNYDGFGLDFGITPAISGGALGMPNLNLSLGLTADSRSGLGFSPNLSYSAKLKESQWDNISLTGQIGTNINSRSGLKELTYGAVMNREKTKVHLNNEGFLRVKDYKSENSLSGTYSFATSSYQPQIEMPMVNNSFSLSGPIGGEAYGAFLGADFTGYFSRQALSESIKSVKSYGLAYMEQNLLGIGLADFNREKDGSFSKYKQLLPIPYLTNDVFSVSGQGIGGSYQIFRGNVGNVHDIKVKSTSNGLSLGAEAGLGNLFRSGGDIHTNFSNSVSGKWDEENQSALFSTNSFANIPDLGGTYEGRYFKAAGESSPFFDNEENVFATVGEFDAVKVELDKSGSEVKALANLKSNNLNNFPVSGPVARSNRVKRNQSISYLTAAEADKFAVDKSVISQHLFPFINGSSSSRINHCNNETHHISEITALRPDGLRYVYGIPAYNRLQKEVTFAANHNNADCSSGLVSYTLENNKPKHKHGNPVISKDNYLNIETTPGFAHSYLLTSILSEDYVDRIGDGPTPDDLGTFTKFNYTKVHGDYKWRIPYQHANHNPGFGSQTNDEKGNYTYGEKEIWILHSVESKTQYAEFIYSSRHDSHPVLNEQGGIDISKSLYKLDKITLYSLPDFTNNSTNPSIRQPIKSVHFEYDYSLCGNVPTNDGFAEIVNTYDINGIVLSSNNINSNRGKLSLKKVYFKYGKSEKGAFSPYKFDYSTFNPSYHIKGYNRWGTYAPALIGGTNCGSPLSITSSEYTWVKQESLYDVIDEKAEIDKNISAWNLKKIFLPSGGIIEVDYEADEYAYVQNKEVMQLFEIVGTGNTSTNLNANCELFTSSYINNYLFFKLSKPIPNGVDQKDYILAHYIKHLLVGKDLFFKVYADLNNSASYEFVQGYAQLGAFDGYGAHDYETGYIKLKNACTKDKEPAPGGNCYGINNDITNPISKTIWQFTRLNLPHLIYGSSENIPSLTNITSDVSNNENDFMSVADAFLSIWSDIKAVFNGGVNNEMKSKNYGSKIIKGKSWIRLYNPYGNKYAGTHRVKKITISDQWAEMSGIPNTNSIYGQEYTYSDIRSIDGVEEVISSGVASSEPVIGSEDSPLKVPLYAYSEEMKMAPDNNHFVEGPIGESLYPSPNVIYSKVKVQNLKYVNVNKKATGFAEYSFYTAKDFPVKTKETTLTAFPKKTNPILKILKVKNQDYMTTSQGYVIELNDMHGKPKSQSIYNEIGTKISAMEYHYKREPGGLVSNVPLLKADGTIQQGTIGVDYNVILDQREARSNTTGAGCNLNNDNFMLGPIPVPAFVPLPFYSNEKTKYRSLVVNKIINRTGILEKTIAYDLGSTVETRNIAWDAITGEVLLTQTFNEFEDPIYNFNYPAHWAYKGMQNAYKNIGAVFTANLNAGPSGVSTVPSGHVFTEGDVVSLGSDKAWIKKVNTTSIELIDFNGNPIVGSGSATLKIIRSGHRNKASTSIGSIVSLLSPIQGLGLNLSGNTQIINAGAIEFDDKRNVPCCDGCTCKIHEIKNNGPAYNFLTNLINGLDFTQITNNYSSLPNDLKQYVGVGICGKGTSTSIPYSYRKFFTNEADGLYCTVMFKTDQTGCECIIKFKVINQNLKKFVISNIELGKGCNPCKATFLGTQTYHQSGGYPDIQYSGEFEIYSECFQLFENCGDCSSEIEPNINNSSFNPYTTNHKGTYSPKKSYTFLAQRKSSSSNNAEPDIRKDGYFTDVFGSPYFTPFWRNTGNVWDKFTTNWTWTAEVTKIHPNGNELESRDPLDRYSSELLGYNDHMVTAVAGNARYGDCMFDGFEDYRYSIGMSLNTNSCPYKYFKFPEAEPVKNLAESHSGKYYQQLQPGHITWAEYDLYKCKEDLPVPEGRVTQIDTTDNSKPCDCLNEFNPQPGKYVFSAWIKEGNNPLQHDYQDGKYIVRIDGNIFEFKAKGPIIEGWQRVYGEFDIPEGSRKIYIGLSASPSEVTGFDDIRIHPFDASFKSFVYDDITLRFTYELDENNFFTKYEYDASGKLERVKKETERGVMTVQETRFSNRKIK